MEEINNKENGRCNSRLSKQLKMTHYKLILALKKEMEYKGIRQSDIAEKLGIKQSNISLILSGNRVPRIDTFNNIAGILNLNRLS